MSESHERYAANLRAAIGDLTDECQDLRHQLAECQALLKVKDAALKMIESQAVLVGVNECSRLAKNALTQTSGTEALNKLIAEAEQRGYGKGVADSMPLKECLTVRMTWDCQGGRRVIQRAITNHDLNQCDDVNGLVNLVCARMYKSLTPALKERK